MRKLYALPAIALVAVLCYVGPLAAQEAVSSRVVEDGGTGPFKAIMVSESALPTHTIFKPSDLNTAAEENKLPIIV